MAIKTLNKQTIIDLLKSSNTLYYNTISGKVYIYNINNDIVGAVQFNTFLKLTLKEITTNYHSHFRKYILQ